LSPEGHYRGESRWKRKPTQDDDADVRGNKKRRADVSSRKHKELGVRFTETELHSLNYPASSVNDAPLAPVVAEEMELMFGELTSDLDSAVVQKEDVIVLDASDISDTPDIVDVEDEELLETCESAKVDENSFEAVFVAGQDDAEMSHSEDMSKFCFSILESAPDSSVLQAEVVNLPAKKDTPERDLLLSNPTEVSELNTDDTVALMHAADRNIPVDEKSSAVENDDERDTMLSQVELSSVRELVTDRNIPVDEKSSAVENDDERDTMLSQVELSSVRELITDIVDQVISAQNEISQVHDLMTSSLLPPTLLISDSQSVASREPISLSADTADVASYIERAPDSVNSSNTEASVCERRRTIPDSSLSSSQCVNEQIDDICSRFVSSRNVKESEQNPVEIECIVTKDVNKEVESSDELPCHLVPYNLASSMTDASALEPVRGQIHTEDGQSDSSGMNVLNGSIDLKSEESVVDKSSSWHLDRESVMQPADDLESLSNASTMSYRSDDVAKLPDVGCVESSVTAGLQTEHDTLYVVPPVEIAEFPLCPSSDAPSVADGELISESRRSIADNPSSVPEETVGEQVPETVEQQRRDCVPPVTCCEQVYNSATDVTHTDGNEETYLTASEDIEAPVAADEDEDDIEIDLL